MSKAFRIVLVLFLLVLVLPFCAFSRTVKVAFFESANFLVGASSDVAKSGYAYEALFEISNHAGWDIEYVYGPWASLYEKFLSGEIDIFPGLAKRDDRSSYMAWSQEKLDTEYHSIFVRLDDVITSVSEKRVGLISNNNMTTEFLQWAQAEGIETVNVYFDEIDDLVTSLENGTIDCFVGSESNIDYSHPIRVLQRIASTDSYIAVSNSSLDLLPELDSAMSTILEESPEFFVNLRQKYYSSRVSNAVLSDSEITWVRENKAIRIGYVDSYLPFSGTDLSGKPTGVIVDIVSNVLSALKLTGYLDVEYVCYKSYNDMLYGLSHGEISCAFPVLNSVWHAENNSLMQTESLVASNISAIYKGTFDTSIFDRIAINANATLQEIFVKENFPSSEIIYCSSMNECLEAVRSGLASCTLYNSSRIHEALVGEYESFSEMSIGRSIGFCFAVKKGNFPVLSLLKRGIDLVSNVDFTQLMFDYVDIQRTVTFRDMIRQNLSVILPVVFMVILSVMFVIMYLFRKSSKLNMELRDALEEANRANKAKTSFLSNMSHDIRTPLNAILGYTSIASKSNPRPEVKKCLDKINDSSELLLMLINNVLDISRIESGDAKLCMEPINLITTVNEVLSVMHGFLVGRKLDFVVSRQPLDYPVVLCDAVRLREILINILSNAVKFTDDGGRIEFCASNKVLNDSTVLVTYSVSDTGVGMSPEFQKTLFERFVQESDSARTNYKGSGLGLSIAKHYIEMMGGNITVQSKKGQGTTFTINLPLKISSAVLDDDLDTESVSLNGRTLNVLLAEDNDLNAEIATQILGSEGLNITRVCDGAEAVEEFSSSFPGTYDLILMDIMMPNLNGYEATRAIREMDSRPDGKVIPIIAMTANAFSEDIQAAFDAGMNAHIAKPFVLEDVIRTISQLMS